MAFQSVQALTSKPSAVFDQTNFTPQFRRIEQIPSSLAIFARRSQESHHETSSDSSVQGRWFQDPSLKVHPWVSTREITSEHFHKNRAQHPIVNLWRDRTFLSIQELTKSNQNKTILTTTGGFSISSELFWGSLRQWSQIILTISKHNTTKFKQRFSI